MKILSILTLLLLLLSNAVSAQQQQGTLIRLVAGLDEPEEYYCIDIAGWRESLALDNPLQGHTCKASNGIDQMFALEDGYIRVTEYGRCLEVAGTSQITLPGSALLARDCDADNPLQNIILNELGQLTVVGTDYCIAAGANSARAAGPSHMWRSLSTADCENVSKELSTWQLGLE